MGQWGSLTEIRKKKEDKLCFITEKLKTQQHDILDLESKGNFKTFLILHVHNNVPL